DYLTGGLALARAVGASYVVHEADEVSFERCPARDGTRFDSGQLEVVARATPGHTANHLAYVLSEDGSPCALFSGGSMLFGSVGRTDLVSKELTEELTRAQYRSVHRLAAELPGTTELFPTHGFGSFCSAGRTTKSGQTTTSGGAASKGEPAAGDGTTIAEEQTTNAAFVAGSEDEFCESLIAGLSDYPSYYVHMSPANLAGPSAPDLSLPRPSEPGELRRRIDAGEWVVDMRDRKLFARSHVTGTISIELGDRFATYLGWTIPWGTPLSLVAETREDVRDAQLELVRIGIEGLAVMAVGAPETLGAGAPASYRRVSFAELSAMLARSTGIVVLDVRRSDEWALGHIAGAKHIPLWEVEARMGEIAEGEVWVHCGSGFRASLAASLIARAGREVVQVDDDWANAVALGLSSAGSAAY
ncbi:MAG: rhodanese-like domain-containing protein, partial [Acidimicrobiales bacterium]